MVTVRIIGLPWWLSSKRIYLPIQETWVQSLGQEDPGEGNGTLLQYSCLGNPIDRGAWRAPLGRSLRSVHLTKMT